MEPYIEQDCVISICGTSCESGGSWLLPRRDNGKLQGILYAYEAESKVGTWHKPENGGWKVYAAFGNEWQNNMGDIRQHVTFELNDRRFSGVYYKSGSDIVRVKEVSKRD